MDLQQKYDDAMFAFSSGDYDRCIAELKTILAQDPAHFDAQLSLGMAHCRKGDFATAVVEGHKAEQLQQKEQLVHTNLSLFYLKLGDRVKAEHHGLQARIAGWREEAKAPPTQTTVDPELQMARPKPPTMKVPEKFPDQPWKKNKPVSGT